MSFAHQIDPATDTIAERSVRRGDSLFRTKCGRRSSTDTKIGLPIDKERVLCLTTLDLFLTGNGLLVTPSVIALLLILHLVSYCLSRTTLSTQSSTPPKSATSFPCLSLHSSIPTRLSSLDGTTGCLRGKSLSCHPHPTVAGRPCLDKRIRVMGKGKIRNVPRRNIRRGGRMNRGARAEY